jgi:ABC-type sugar transport system permease subunit
MDTEVERLKAEVTRLQAELDKKPTLREMFWLPIVFATIVVTIGAALGGAFAVLIYKAL